VSAAPEYVMNEPPESFGPERRDPMRNAPQVRDREKPEQTFWHWFALGVLVFCWIAEASMCAERGF
jgi:hypothetical protein